MEWTLLARDWRTLEVVGQVSAFTDWRHTRRDVRAGDFSLTLPAEAVEPNLLIDTNRHTGRLIEVRRDGEREFAGVIRSGRYDLVHGQWTFEGPDLLGWFLARRVVGIEAADDRAGPAETLLKGYVDDHGGAGADPERRFSAELDGIGWTVEADQGRGAHVDFAALRRNLLTDVAVPLARSGDLLHEVAIQEEAGYVYRVSEPGAANTQLSLARETAAEGTEYRFDLAGLRNAVTVLGGGSGDARDQTLVTDTDSVARYGRWEGLLDERDGGTVEARTAAGLREMAEREHARETALAQPNPVTTSYRDDYDVGQDIEVVLPEVGIATKRRIVAASVELSGRGERITLELGDSPATLGSLMTGALRRGLRAQFE